MVNNYEFDIDYEDDTEDCPKHNLPDYVSKSRQKYFPRVAYTQEFTGSWSFVEERFKSCIQTLQKGLQVKPSQYQDLYTEIYNRCAVHGYLEQIYQKCCETLEEYIATVNASLESKLCSDEYLLREVVKEWKIYEEILQWISDLLNFPGIREYGLGLFDRCVYQPIKCRVRDFVISEIEGEREGDFLDRNMVIDVLCMFHAIAVEAYKEDFEAYLLKKVGEYYSGKRSEWIEGCSSESEDYKGKVEQCLELEKGRISYLLGESKEKVLDVLKHELLEKTESDDSSSRKRSRSRSSPYLAETILQELAEENMFQGLKFGGDLSLTLNSEDNKMRDEKWKKQKIIELEACSERVEEMFFKIERALVELKSSS